LNSNKYFLNDLANEYFISEQNAAFGLDYNKDILKTFTQRQLKLTD